MKVKTPEQLERERLRRIKKAKLLELNKQKDELFRVWVLRKAMDEDFVRNEALRVFSEIKQLRGEL